jgi:hypothetical protein
MSINLMENSIKFIDIINPDFTFIAQFHEPNVLGKLRIGI